MEHTGLAFENQEYEGKFMTSEPIFKVEGFSSFKEHTANPERKEFKMSWFTGQKIHCPFQKHSSETLGHLKGQP